MGKKKNKKVTDGAGGAAGCVTARDTSFLEQQQRLLDECRPNPAASTGGSSGSDARSSCVKRNPAAAQDAVGTRSRLVDDGETSVDAVIRQQQRLLDQASQGGPAVYNASAVQASAASNADVFQVRRVRFGARSNVPVLMQGRNGPCALLAVANGLLLRGTLNLNDDEKALSSEELIHRLATLCETLNAKSMRDDAAFRQGVSQVVERLPKLLDGLLLNCRFSSCVDFEYTLDLGLFDLFGLRLFHAWVCPEVANIACSWNALAEALAVSYEIRMALESDSERSTTPAEDEKLAQGYWLDEWLEETRTQTTPRGIQELATLVNDREVGVFFRNNHFSTIYKHGNDVLCALLTDESFEDVESAVWETIDMDCGVILDASFAPLEAAQHSRGRNSRGETQDCARSNGRSSSIIAPGEDPRHEELLAAVEDLGFSREQAEASLVAVAWSSVEDALELLLNGGDAASSDDDASASAPSTRHVGGGGSSSSLKCPSCAKRFSSKHGLVSHRAAKGH